MNKNYYIRFMREQMKDGKSTQDILESLAEAANEIEKEQSYAKDFVKKFGNKKIDTLAKELVAYCIKDDLNVSKDTLEGYIDITKAFISELHFY